jgi:hypothetical protein
MNEGVYLPSVLLNAVIGELSKADPPMTASPINSAKHPGKKCVTPRPSETTTSWEIETAQPKAPEKAPGTSLAKVQEHAAKKQTQAQATTEQPKAKTEANQAGIYTPKQVTFLEAGSMK